MTTKHDDLINTGCEQEDGTNLYFAYCTSMAPHANDLFCTSAVSQEDALLKLAMKLAKRCQLVYKALTGDVVN